MLAQKILDVLSLGCGFAGRIAVELEECEEDFFIFEQIDGETLELREAGDFV